MRTSGDSNLLPRGFVTLLLTDIEGSTRLWESVSDAMPAALAWLDEVLEAAASANGGVLLKSKGEGDSAFLVFGDALDAASAAATIQHHLADRTDRLLRLRVALHSAQLDPTGGDYFGPPVNRCARLRGVASGGQVLCSDATADAIRDRLPGWASLRSLGKHRLRDLTLPEHIHQLDIAGLPTEFPPVKSVGVDVHNLPAYTTAFVGRRVELAQLSRAVPDRRVVTIVGLGGLGKTRLAAETATRLLDDHFEGSWFVPLADVQVQDDVPRYVVDALGLHVVAGQPHEATLIAMLRDRASLLVLDNCEHVVEAVSALTATLVEACPGLHVLATSRTPLEVAGETLVRIDGISTTPDREGRSDALELLLARVEENAPGLEMSAEAAATAMQICAQLEGIPLAIELVGARLRTMTFTEIWERLSQRLDMLTTSSRAHPERHRTMRATIGWSFDLLDEPARTLLARLSIFPAGWDLTSAEQVCGDGLGDVARLHEQLIDRSLITSGSPAAGRMRFRMYEVVRAFAAERLADTDEAEAVRNRHLDHLLAVTDRSTGLRTPEWGDTLQSLLPDIQAALAHALAVHRSDDGARLAIRCEGVWDKRGYWRQGLTWLLAFLEKLDEYDTDLLARAHLAAAVSACGRDPSAIGLAERALDLALRNGEPALVARAYLTRANAAWFSGIRSEDLLSLYQQAVLYAEAGSDAEIAALCLNNLASEHHDHGRSDLARRCYERSLTKVDASNYEAAYTLRDLAELDLEAGELDGAMRSLDRAKGVGGSDFRLRSAILQLEARLLIERGDHDAAAASLREALELLQQDAVPLNIAEGLRFAALFLARRGQAALATRLAGAVQALMPLDEDALKDLLASVADGLSPDRRDLAVREGRLWSAADALEAAGSALAV